jgi:acyl carrier protein
MTSTVVEDRVRAMTAEFFGVEASELVPDVSLVDDLAVDGVDLLELVIALEADLGISVPEHAIARVSTYGDLVALVTRLRDEQRQRTASAEAPPVFVWTLVTRTEDGVRRAIQRAGWFTPYLVQTIAEDALRAGTGARLEVSAAADTDPAALARIEAELVWLTDRGVELEVRRDSARTAAARGVSAAA